MEYATNPTRFKEDLGKAKQEIEDIGKAIKESINDRGDDNRNFLGQLSESRLRTTIDNIAGNRLEKAKDQKEIAKAFEDAYKDLGYKAQVIYTDPKNSTRSGLIGTISEEGSHIIGKVEGRQLKTGTEEKGLESTGRATNEYFTDKYKKNDILIKAKSDGKDYSNVDFGENVGDSGFLIAGIGARGYERVMKNLSEKEKLTKEYYDKIRKTSNEKEREKLLKQASGKLFLGYRSVYLSIYLAPDDIRNMYLEKEGKLKDPILYIERFPVEYEKIMNLKKVKNGFSKGIENLGKQLENEFEKLKFIKNGSKFTINVNPRDKPQTIKIDLTGLGGSTDWGRTYLRIKLDMANIEKIETGYRVTVKYRTRMFDEFKDVAGIGNSSGGSELKGGKPYNVGTKWLESTKTFNVKSINEISDKLKGSF